MKLRQLRDSLPAVMICDACVLLLPDYCSAMWQEVWENTARSVQWILELYNTMQLIYSRPPRMPRAELRKEMSWMPLTKRREIWLHITLVHRCICNQAATCTYLMETFWSNELYGH